MAFEHLNRKQRRAARVYTEREAPKRPATLTEIPQEQFGAWKMQTGITPPLVAWQSRKYLAQLYAVGEGAPEVMRLSVCRVTIKTSGQWEDGLSWEELMQVKREVGFGDFYATEIYPRDVDIVNVSNMRHLWIYPEPLKAGWFAGEVS